LKKIGKNPTTNCPLILSGKVGNKFTFEAGRCFLQRWTNNGVSGRTARQVIGDDVD
jgi:hypothetical protein